MPSMKSFFDHFKQYANRPWYGAFIALLAGLDSFVFLFPTDALVISAAVLAPRRWISNALVVGLGSSLGALLLAMLLQRLGLPWLLHLQPNLRETNAWIWADSLMAQWGLWAVLVVSFTPTMQQPVVALAAVAGISPASIFLASLAGRIGKYGIYGYLGAHAPGLLDRVWAKKKKNPRG